MQAVCNRVVKLIALNSTVSKYPQQFNFVAVVSKQIWNADY